MAANSLYSSNSDLQQLQMRVLEKLIHFKDEAFWKRLEQMLLEEEANANTPISKEDFLASIEQGEQAIQEGNLYSLEDIIRETENY